MARAPTTQRGQRADVYEEVRLAVGGAPGRECSSVAARGAARLFPDRPGREATPTPRRGARRAGRRQASRCTTAPRPGRDSRRGGDPAARRARPCASSPTSAQRLRPRRPPFPCTRPRSPAPTATAAGQRTRTRRVGEGSAWVSSGDACNVAGAARRLQPSHDDACADRETDADRGQALQEFP